VSGLIELASFCILGSRLDRWGIFYEMAEVVTLNFLPASCARRRTFNCQKMVILRGDKTFTSPGVTTQPAAASNGVRIAV
jgi:hypothetical protein